MTPPYCAVCGKDFRGEYFHTGKGGDLLRFRDYAPLADGAVGMPRGAAWFCRMHLEDARTLDAQPLGEAIEVLRRRFGGFPPPAIGPMPDPELWVVCAGSNLAAVLRLVRSSSGWTPAQARERLMAGPFCLASGWPCELAPWVELLRQAGASVEIRYP
ncbi:hypothetical protein A6723_001810 [Pseudomonas sp. AU11447]|uniref:hypothetical protein n=1 Tax=unclassified Pseudomonas TaxID=196821 RepID=UPI0006D43AE2|nr:MULTISPECIES: hypothetical protein [unclassified Pseudomonas]OBY87956.1 hypothetical protein A6723_001810 [Pseudomonas sp. AU11447]